MDRLLSTSATHLLGRWLAKAKAKGANTTAAAEGALYEFNARNQGRRDRNAAKQRERREGGGMAPGAFELWSGITGLAVKTMPLDA